MSKKKTWFWHLFNRIYLLYGGFLALVDSWKNPAWLWLTMVDSDRFWVGPVCFGLSSHAYLIYLIYKKIKEKLTPTLIQFGLRCLCNKTNIKISFGLIISKNNLAKFLVLCVNRQVRT